MWLYLSIVAQLVITGLSVPIIDLSDMNEDTLSQIDSALIEHGLFIAVGLEIKFRDESKNWHDLSIQESRRLFEIDESIKNSISMKTEGSDTLFRGYIGFGKESGLKNKIFEPKEGYSYGFPFQNSTRNQMQGMNKYSDIPIKVAIAPAFVLHVISSKV